MLATFEAILIPVIPFGSDFFVQLIPAFPLLVVIIITFIHLMLSYDKAGT
jgi:hypothetical protein